VPVTPPPSEPALPFRPTTTATEDEEARKSRIAALGASSALPFQPSAPGLGMTLGQRAPEPSPPISPPPAPPPPAPIPDVAPRPLMQLSMTPAAIEPIVTKPREEQPEKRALEPAIERKPKATLSVERYARIKVDLWGAPAALRDVLEKHGIDEIEWRIHEKRQAEALEEEARGGKCDLALALVAAFESAKTPSPAPPPPL
jgi:hypothetical protein